MAVVVKGKSCIVYMLENDKFEDLNRMYKLFRLFDRGVATIFDVVSAHLRKEGESILDKEGKANAIQFVDALLSLKDKYEKFLFSSFENDVHFWKTIDKDFKYFLNFNPTSIEFLSLFIDDKLRKNIKKMSDPEIEATLEKTIGLVHYIQDKDIFERYYKQHMAQRLLLNQCFSVHLEGSMIYKLKTQFGSLFAYKLERMLKDVFISANYYWDFQTHVEKHSLEINLDLNVRVLSYAHWPTAANISECKIPSDAHLAYKAFEKFYLNNHNGRKLTLQAHLGYAELTAEFYSPIKKSIESCSSGYSKSKESDETFSGPMNLEDDSNSKKQVQLVNPREHILRVSTFQMAILLLFNDRPRLTYEDIKNETQIDDKFLTRALQSLAIAKASQQVLVKFPKTKEIKPNHYFKVNDSFISTPYLVEIQAVMAQTGKPEPERKPIRLKIDEDRKHEIEAAVVRIMKSRQKMELANLVAEVTEQLKFRFNPDPELVKKRIQGLIDREYLAQSPDDRQLYTYIL